MRSRIIIVIVLIAAAVGGWVYYTEQADANGGIFIVSETIEVTETNLPTLSGGQVKQVLGSEADLIQKDQPLVVVYSQASKTNERITSQIDGTVLERLVEPNEMAAPGSTVLVIAPLDQLYLKIYVPENRYGQVALGQSYPVTVDSFPGETFSGKVSFISSKAEFTPRNVQTTDSRQTTVYAVKLNLDPSGGKLKPGMPADFHFALQ